MALPEFLKLVYQPSEFLQCHEQRLESWLLKEFRIIDVRLLTLVFLYQY
jgi:hypothetical protein